MAPKKKEIDVIIDGLAEELTDLAELKDKRLDLVLKHSDITDYLGTLRSAESTIVQKGLVEDANRVLIAHTQYADFLKDGSLADIMYKNMKEYLAGVIEHLRVYKVEKANMVAQMAEIDANLKAMKTTSLSLMDKVSKHVVPVTQRGARSPGGASSGCAKSKRPSKRL